ncbi:UvrB/UvrC motif-containing protein [Chlamydia sp.]|uniref:UvrB/UvrC motif-containing protein n=1 Tax=Chlamydia sp. TaxID=35827 RepID=UPI0025C2DB3C|nr:UvrB/UvrC motif-containing protein [Chlamydia sp.]MBQ8498828.1 UvrB/UvrC motif-containing protein [Chlamydia sp.]
MTLSESSALCYNCQQPATICFTEISDTITSRCYVCDNCPYPSRYYDRETLLASPTNLELILECGNCKTKWCIRDTDKILLGCPLCYRTFKSLILSRLLRYQAISSYTSDKTNHFHIGRALGNVETPSVTPAMQLIALHEALQETLRREDYEQAAEIRDQINQLKNQNTTDAS